MQIPKWKDLDELFTFVKTISVLRNFEPVGSSSRFSPETLSNPKRKILSFSTKLKRRVCTYCSGNHLMNICPTFLDLSPERRFLVVKRNNFCINCLISAHRLSEYRSTFSCSVCKLKHHTPLHREVSGTSSEKGALDAPGSSGAVR